MLPLYLLHVHEDVCSENLSFWTLNLDLATELVQISAILQDRHLTLVTWLPITGYVNLVFHRMCCEFLYKQITSKYQQPMSVK